MPNLLKPRAHISHSLLFAASGLGADKRAVTIRGISMSAETALLSVI
jgi:hypothetical protein